MTTVRNILFSKGSEIWSISSDKSIFDALKVMAEKNIGALLVIDNDNLVGIFSERDYAREVVSKGEPLQKNKIREIMTSAVITVKPEQSIEECMTLMTNKHVRHLPVKENNKIIGLISIGDVVKAIISQHEDTIKHLENYIMGSR